MIARIEEAYIVKRNDGVLLIKTKNSIVLDYMVQWGT